MIKYLLISLLFISNNGYSRDFLPIPTNFSQIIGVIESNNNDFAIGDKGKALGRYQIWLICYQDCTNYDKSISFSYQSLTNKGNSDQIMKVYLNKYGRDLIKSNDFISLARLWNAGPNWKNNLDKTTNYVRKFKMAAKKS